VQLFAHIPFVVNRAFNVTPKGGNKTINCKIFAGKGSIKADDVSFATIIYITLVSAI